MAFNVILAMGEVQWTGLFTRGEAEFAHENFVVVR